MRELDEKTLIDRYLAAYNAFDIDGMTQVLAPTIRFENYSDDQLTAAATGIEEFRQLAAQSKEFFAEREQRITALVNTEDCLVASIVYRGRLSKDIPNGPSAGMILNLSGTSEFSFDGGLITKIVDRS
jgi:ketosteroid isomerase-like protein